MGPVPAPKKALLYAIPPIEQAKHLKEPISTTQDARKSIHVMNAIATPEEYSLSTYLLMSRSS